MNKKILDVIAPGLFAATLTAAFAFPAQAAADCKISCAQPIGVGRGNKVPVWTVARCVIGRPGSWATVDCKSPRAINYVAGRLPYVCFFGSDGKIHEDSPSWVWVGRKFINRFANGRWQPDYQD